MKWYVPLFFNVFLAVTCVNRWPETSLHTTTCVCGNHHCGPCFCTFKEVQAAHVIADQITLEPENNAQAKLSLAGISKHPSTQVQYMQDPTRETAVHSFVPE